jgi:hypothetical protein
VELRQGCAAQPLNEDGGNSWPNVPPWPFSTFPPSSSTLDLSRCDSKNYRVSITPSLLSASSSSSSGLSQADQIRSDHRIGKPCRQPASHSFETRVHSGTNSSHTPPPARHSSLTTLSVTQLHPHPHPHPLLSPSLFHTVFCLSSVFRLIPRLPD